MAGTDEAHVTLVVDPHFGERAKAQYLLGPVWLVRSPENCKVVEELWAQDRPRSSDRVTWFDPWPGANPEDLVVDFVGTVDEHHPDWKLFEVTGVSLSARLLAAFQERAAGFASETKSGFVFHRAPK